MLRFALPLALIAPAALAEPISTAAGAAAQAFVLNGGGGESPSDITGLATTPDAIAPSLAGSGRGSCIVPRSSRSVSVAFVAVADGEFALDRFCQALDLAQASMELAVAYDSSSGNSDTIRNLRRADMLISAATGVFMSGSDAWSEAAWQEMWNP